jgi:hypothetical protein
MVCVRDQEQLYEGIDCAGVFVALLFQVALIDTPTEQHRLYGGEQVKAKKRCNDDYEASTKHVS